jgi:hypothetical protein
MDAADIAAAVADNKFVVAVVVQLGIAVAVVVVVARLVFAKTNLTMK